MDNSEIKEIEEKISYEFDNKSLIKRALTHSSFANANNTKSNERLEFFGDSILDFIVSEFLMETIENDEGDLSKLRARLVSAESLEKIIEELDIVQYMRVGNGFKTFSPKFKANIYESVLGAIYLDGGLDEAEDFVYNTLNLCEERLQEIWDSSIDYKTKLQEFLQQNGNVNIEYKTISETGPAHNPVFTIALFINGKQIISADANSKKGAEQDCARIALNNSLV